MMITGMAAAVQGAEPGDPGDPPAKLEGWQPIRGDGRRQLSQSLQRHAQVGMGIGKSRLKADDLLVGVYGFLEAPLAMPGDRRRHQRVDILPLACRPAFLAVHLRNNNSGDLMGCRFSGRTPLPMTAFRHSSEALDRFQAVNPIIRLVQKRFGCQRHQCAGLGKVGFRGQPPAGIRKPLTEAVGQAMMSLFRPVGASAMDFPSATPGYADVQVQVAAEQSCKVKKNIVPSLESGSIQMRPPWCSTIFLHTANPMPVPS